MQMEAPCPLGQQQWGHLVGSGPFLPSPGARGSMVGQMVASKRAYTNEYFLELLLPVPLYPQ